MLNFEDSVKAVVQVFSVVVALALQRFLMERSHLDEQTEFKGLDHKTDRVLYWSCFIILVSLVLRFVIGASAHLHDAYVNYPHEHRAPWVIARFLKDLVFPFGVLLVKLALSKKASFPAWLMGFAFVGIGWALIEIPIERLTGDATHFGLLWLVINFVSAALTWIALRLLRGTFGAAHEKPIYVCLAILFSVLFLADLTGVMKVRRPPEQPAELLNPAGSGTHH